METYCGGVTNDVVEVEKKVFQVQGEYQKKPTHNVPLSRFRNRRFVSTLRLFRDQRMVWTLSTVAFTVSNPCRRAGPKAIGQQHNKFRSSKTGQ
jgi:uncharacterized protein YcbX